MIAKSNGIAGTGARKAIGVDKQRIYDAMLIKAFRKGVKMKDLENWLKPYDIKLDKCGLMRIPNYVVWMGEVRVMVGVYLKPLADKLWDTDVSQDIKTLDWMQNLKCEKTNQSIQKEKTKIRKDSDLAFKKTKILGNALQKCLKSNQWNVVKSTKIK